MPEARPKIEREKIRRPRTNDLLFDEGEAPVPRQSPVTRDLDQGAPIDDNRYQASEEDWTAEENETQEASVAWDHDPEDDWVLDGAGRGQAEDVVNVFEGEEDVQDDFESEEESGVVWEDEAFPEAYPGDSPDELSFGSQSKNVSSAPEVELAGRRDVRPKAPRPVPEPRNRQPDPQQRRERPPQGHPQARQPQSDWDDSDETIAPQHGFRDPRFEQRQQPIEPTHADGERLSKMRAPLGGPAASLAGEPEEELLERSRSSRPQRRRQPQPAPVSPRAGPRKTTVRQKGPSRGLIAIIFLALLAGGGWLIYQMTGPHDVRSMLDGFSAFIPGSSRTAADTSFRGQDANETDAVSAEQALSNLEERLRQQEGDEAQPTTSSTAGADGPPIPQFKPLPGVTRSATATTPADAADDGNAADDEQINGLSIFQQLWRFLTPG